MSDEIASMLAALKEQFQSLVPEGEQTPAPRQPRRRPRKPEQRGLPDGEARLRLARTWLEDQRRLWPELAGTPLLPDVSEEALKQLADEFEARFLNGSVAPFTHAFASPPWTQVGGTYDRYSSDKSNQASLDQQLHKQLKEARSQHVFIPWQYVYADAAATGTTAARHGYTLVKKAVVELNEHGFDTLYIDEIGRAARDALEALRLGRLMEERHKRLIGVTDRFDSFTRDAKLRLHMFAMMEENYSAQLGERMLRGRDYAFFNTATAVKTPAVGYMLVPAFDDKGRPVTGKQSEQLNVEVVNPAEAPFVVLAFKLRGERRWGRGRIVQMFNEHQVAGRSSWTENAIKKMFERLDYIGIEIDGRFRTHRDPETGTVRREERPRSEWRVRKVPDKAFVPKALFKQAWRVEREVAEAYGKGDRRVTRSQVNPKTPLSGVLICDHCENELIQGHAGKWPQFCCFNGIHGRHGCTARGHKSARIIGRSITDYLRDVIFTEERVTALVEKTNAHLAEMRQRPQTDTAPWEKQARKLETAIDRLFGLIEGEQDEAVCQRYHQRIKQRQQELSEIQTKLVEARRQTTVPVMEVDRAEVLGLLGDLWGLLEQGEPGEVAPLLKQLLGPVRVEQRPVPGQAKPSWFAKFIVDQVQVVLELARRQNSPTTCTWGTLSAGGWTLPVHAEVKLEYVPRHARLAPEVKGLVDAYEQAHGHREGAIQRAADALDIHWTQARDALQYAETGESPRRRDQSDRQKPRSSAQASRCQTVDGQPPYKAIAARVAHLRDEEEMSWAQIADTVGWSAKTCGRAYDHYHRDAIRAAAARGEKPPRGKAGTIPAETRRRVRQMIEQRKRVGDIVAETGVSQMTVYREKRKMKEVKSILPQQEAS